MLGESWLLLSKYDPKVCLGLFCIGDFNGGNPPDARTVSSLPLAVTRFSFPMYRTNPQIRRAQSLKLKQFEKKKNKSKLESKPQRQKKPAEKQIEKQLVLILSIPILVFRAPH
jgi:hypothetical protein